MDVGADRWPDGRQLPIALDANQALFGNTNPSRSLGLRPGLARLLTVRHGGKMVDIVAQRKKGFHAPNW
jgi:hypothetical protein